MIIIAQLFENKTRWRSSNQTRLSGMTTPCWSQQVSLRSQTKRSKVLLTSLRRLARIKKSAIKITSTVSCRQENSPMLALSGCVTFHPSLPRKLMWSTYKTSLMQRSNAHKLERQVFAHSVKNFSHSASMSSLGRLPSMLLSVASFSCV